MATSVEVDDEIVIKPMPDTLFIRLSWLFCKINVLCVHMTELILWVLM